MKEYRIKPVICGNEQAKPVHQQDHIDSIVDKLVSSCTKDDCYNNADLPPLPSKGALTDIIRQTQEIVFPGYFGEAHIDALGLRHHIGRVVLSLYKNLKTQIILPMRHNCLRDRIYKFLIYTAQLPVRRR